MSMKKRTAGKAGTVEQTYYDSRPILKEIEEETVDLGLTDELRADILHQRRKRRMVNISIKIDPIYLVSVKKIAVMKGLPYQTLIRQWLTEKMRKELKLA